MNTRIPSLDTSTACSGAVEAFILIPSAPPLQTRNGVPS
jgi:hypothetical protein